MYKFRGKLSDGRTFSGSSASNDLGVAVASIGAQLPNDAGLLSIRFTWVPSDATAVKIKAPSANAEAPRAPSKRSRK